MNKPDMMRSLMHMLKSDGLSISVTTRRVGFDYQTASKNQSQSTAGAVAGFLGRTSR